MANEKLSLHSLKNVNTVLSMLYDKDGNYRPGFKPEEFYNTILLDTLKYGEENYVHLKYCETINVRKGEKTAKFRRWAGMTPTLRPLQEGIPPMADKHAYETMEVGNVFNFGRWSEYTDEIDMSVISDIVSERAVQYGENANQTKELYARKTWLAAPNEFFANFKQDFSDIYFGDAITIDDLRFLTERMKRVMVKPVGGKFNYICSQEFINGLIDDPRVKMYMEINQTTGNLWTAGEVFPLFELNFIPTMLDEFAYPDIEFPGVYEKPSDGKEVMRLYAIDGVNKKVYYLDVHQDFVVKDTTKMKTHEGPTYLADGTAIEDKINWELPSDCTPLTSDTVGSAEATETKCKFMVGTYTRQASTAPYDYGVVRTQFEAPAYPSSALAAELTAVNALLAQGAFIQLPVHRGILFGDEAMIKINIEGKTDQPEIIIKALGSAGTNDALNQRQTVGYKVTGFGLAIKRPEAIVITYGIPTNAEFAALTTKFVNSRNYTLLDNPNGADDYNKIATDGYGNDVHQMQVDGINATKVNPANVVVDGNNFPEFAKATAYAVGDVFRIKFTTTVGTGGVAVENKVYAVIKAITASTIADSAATYAKTSDLTCQVGKTYYTVSDNVYTAVASPLDANIGSYYEKTADAVSYDTPDKILSALKAGKYVVELKAMLFHNILNNNSNDPNSNVR